MSPKFVSEPNLSLLDVNDETPKKKRGNRLFRSKIVSHTMNKKYQKRNGVIRGTPTCVSCFDDQDTGSENDGSYNEISEDRCPIEDTPKKAVLENDMKHYLTSTPGISDAIFDDDCATPYTINFRRASMSPITKSTQKLSKAMQVCLHVCICMNHLSFLLLMFNVLFECISTYFCIKI